jgi:hypothetical protein
MGEELIMQKFGSPEPVEVQKDEQPEGLRREAAKEPEWTPTDSAELAQENRDTDQE